MELTESEHARQRNRARERERVRKCTIGEAKRNIDFHSKATFTSKQSRLWVKKKLIMNTN